MDDWYLDFKADWRRRYAFEPLEVDTRRPWALGLKERVAAQHVSLVLGGEVACWGACMRSLVDGDREVGCHLPGREGGSLCAGGAHLPTAVSQAGEGRHTGLLATDMLQAVLAAAERLWSPEQVTDQVSRSHLISGGGSVHGRTSSEGVGGRRLLGRSHRTQTHGQLCTAGLRGRPAGGGSGLGPFCCADREVMIANATPLFEPRNVATKSPGSHF